jgi:hypothetical protein
MVLPTTGSGFGIGVAVFVVGMHLRRNMKQDKSKFGNSDADLNLQDTTKMIIAGSVCAGVSFLITTVFGKFVRLSLLNTKI